MVNFKKKAPEGLVEFVKNIPNMTDAELNAAEVAVKGGVNQVLPEDADRN